MKPPALTPSRSKKARAAAAFCNLPLLLLIGAIQFLVIYSPAIDRYMVMVTKGKPGFPSLLLDGRRGFKLVEEETIPVPRVRCDFADPRSDVCELEGAIRIRGSTSEVFVVAPAAGDGLRLAANVTGLPAGMNATSWTIQPYTRKGEARVMRGITTLTVRVVSAGDAPPCTVRHDVPAVVYSNGGYCGNYYHDFNDNIIPLFVTARHLAGEVQLLVAQKQPWWFHKYREIVDGLTNYAAVDLAGAGAGEDDEVRCFRRATLGLHSHKDLSIDPRRAPRNLSMVDFKRFLMWRYALPREHAIQLEEEEEEAVAGAARRRPRLLVVTRRSRRRFVNLPEIVKLAEEVGFDVTASDLMSGTASKNSKAAAGVGDEGHSRMPEVSKLVNSFDAMVAVHGSGLTNLVFLPMNAVVVQVVPLGRMEGLAMDEYGVPPRDMNMRYLQYNITAEESTLSEVYPKAHPVLLDPMPIHEQSWSLVKDVYLGKQDVRLDVRRFRPVLLKAIQLLR